MQRRTTVAVVAAAVAAAVAVGLGASGCGGDDGGGTAVRLGVDRFVEDPPAGPVEVTGALVVTAAQIRLCAAVLESYPPQCGEPSVALDGLDLAAVPGTTTAGGVTWSDGVVLVLQTAGAGRATVLAVVG